MRRFAWVAGAVVALTLAVLVSLNLPAAVHHNARAAEVGGHDQRLDELASDEAGLHARIDDARADLDSQGEDNDGAEERIRKQDRRIRRLQDRIEELEG